MAINFPSTAGQATDGSYTYTVAGIVYSWNGSSWGAAGAGASATDRSLFSVTTNAAGTAALSYNNSNGVFSYTPPNLSSYLTAEADTLASVAGRGATTTTELTADGGFIVPIGTSNQGFSLKNGGSTHLTIHWSNSASKNYLSGDGNYELVIDNHSSVKIAATNAIELDYGATTRIETSNTGATITGALTAGGLTYPTSNGTGGQVLTSDGAGNVTWTAGGLQSRATTGVTQSIANGASSDVSITAPSGYALLAIETSHASWVTLYSDTASRTLDATRAITNDPLPGSGVLAEVITTGAATQKITPGIICFNSGGAGNNTTYAKINNRSGSTNNITVTLTYITLEA